MTKETLSKIYYQPKHLWTGRKAIKLLQKESGEPSKVVKTWLAKQAFWQIHLPRPKKIKYAHFFVTQPNKIHQADLLYLPHDKVYQNTYKYTLNVIDISSGYIASRPLKTKKASEVAEMFKDIYRKGPLRFPDELHVDSGTEFKGDVLKLMKEHNVPVKSAVTKYHHNFTAFVENFNKQLAVKLFKPQDAQELRSGKDSKIWVKNLQMFVSKLNSTKLERVGMTPAKAVKLNSVELKTKPYEPEDISPTDGLYRYLLEPGEENSDSKRRATDNVWSRETFRLDHIIENPGQRVLYYLEGGPKRAFVREELMLIPEDSQVPPELVKDW